MLGRLVTLETYMNAMQAHLVKNQLEAAGIRCVLADVFSATAVWTLTTAIGGIKLQVAEEDFEQAAVVLNAIQQRRDADEEVTDSKSVASSADEEADTEPKPGADDEDAEPKLNAREQDVERAYRTALFGLIFFPLQFYATWLLLGVWQSDEPIRPAVRRKLYWAIGFNVPMVIIATVASLSWLRALVYGHEM